jgi:uncharacterized delta-60 repeat protein
MFGWVHTLTGILTLAILLTLLVIPAASAAPGDLDQSFGQGGHAFVQVNRACLRACVEFGGSYADALALQPDGGIVLGGYDNYIGAESPPDATPGALVRLRPNGTLDTLFGGSGGIVNVPFAVDEIQTNARGGLRVTGEAGQRTGVQRYTSSGVLDGFFGDRGVRWLPRRAEGRRDAAGRTLQVVTIVVPATDYDAQTTRLDVTRLLPSGKRDMRFGRQGFAALPNSTGARSAELTPQPDGSIIAAFDMESYALPSNPSRLLLERLTPTGKPDRTFGRRGVVRAPLKGAVTGATMLSAPDGDILLAGDERRGPGQGENDLILAAYTYAGRLDHGFGKGGIARSKLIVRGRNPKVEVRAVTFDSEGEMIMVGQLGFPTVDTPSGNGFLARYTPHGRDCSFGVGGLVVDDDIGAANAVAIQPNGRIVVAGWGGHSFLAARYMGGGRPRTCPKEG